MTNIYLISAFIITVASLIALARTHKLRQKDLKVLKEIKKAKEALSRSIFYHGDSDIPNYKYFMQKLIKVDRKYTSYHVSLIKLGRTPVFDSVESHQEAISSLFEKIGKQCQPFAVALHDAEYMVMAFVAQGYAYNPAETKAKQLEILENLPKQVTIQGSQVPIDYAISSLSLTGHSSIYGIDKVQRRLTFSMQYALENIDGTFIHNEKLYQTEMYRKHVLRKLTSSLSFKQEDFYLVFQPIFSSHDLETPLRYEALIRWRNQKNIGPKTFMPMLNDKPHLQGELAKIVINQVYAMLKVQLESGETVRPIHVNVAAEQLTNNQLLSHLKAILKDKPAISSYITFEIVEDSELISSEPVKNMMRKITNLGFSFAIDDFGKGYANFNLLHNPYFKILKVDKEYIAKIKSRRDESAVLNKVIDLAKSCKLDIVVEGVENQYQHEYVKRFGNIFIQGFYASVPLTMNEYLSSKETDIAAA